MAENFPKMEKRRDTQAREGQRDPSKTNPPERNITIKISKIRDEQRILKAARESKSLCIIESLSDYYLIFQQKLYRSERTGMIYSKCWGKKLTTKNILLGKVTIQN